MDFLITGQPRCRTAWLTALINAHGKRCYHDVFVYHVPHGATDYGVCDPALALMAPKMAVDVSLKRPSVWLYRDQKEAHEAMERAGGVSIQKNTWKTYQRNARKALVQGQWDLSLHPKDLDDDNTVGEVIKVCTKLEPSSELIQIFQRLRIEEHMAKAKTFASLTSQSEYLKR